MTKVLFNQIIFVNQKKFSIQKITKDSKLLLFPSGPGLASLKSNSNYHKALMKADLVFFDSGFFVILLNLLKKIKVHKFSGYKFLVLFFNFLKKNNDKKILTIDPNKVLSKNNKDFLKKMGIKNIFNYCAPNYNPKQIKDKKLVNLVNNYKPDYILTNIGGGTQEILGLYLKENINCKSSIFCTGGAISYFTGDQAPINNFLDTYYLGWITRILFKPSIFFLRYIKAIWLILVVINSKVREIK